MRAGRARLVGDAMQKREEAWLLRGVDLDVAHGLGALAEEQPLEHEDREGGHQHAAEQRRRRPVAVAKGADHQLPGRPDETRRERHVDRDEGRERDQRCPYSPAVARARRREVTRNPEGYGTTQLFHGDTMVGQPREPRKRTSAYVRGPSVSGPSEPRPHTNRGALRRLAAPRVRGPNPGGHRATFIRVRVPVAPAHRFEETRAQAVDAGDAAAWPRAPVASLTELPVAAVEILEARHPRSGRRERAQIGQARVEAGAVDRAARLARRALRVSTAERNRLLHAPGDAPRRPRCLVD